MPITDRNLGAGTKLVATYKRAQVICEVVETQDGLRYQLADGKLFKSPSAAGSAVMGGVACNGWRFWTLEGEAKPAAEPNAKAARAKKGSLLKQIRKVPNQRGVPEGSTKFFCSACMRGFVVEGSVEPTACPEGHAREVEDTLAPIA